MASVESSLAQVEASRVVQLAIEYGGKLHNLNKSLIQSVTTPPGAGSTQFHAVYQEVKRLAPVCHDLAQALSQLIEHGNLELFDKLECRLRLAELESSINTSEQLLADHKTNYRWKF